MEFYHIFDVTLMARMLEGFLQNKLQNHSGLQPSVRRFLAHVSAGQLRSICAGLGSRSAYGLWASSLSLNKWLPNSKNILEGLSGRSGFVPQRSLGNSRRFFCCHKWEKGCRS